MHETQTNIQIYGLLHRLFFPTKSYVATNSPTKYVVNSRCADDFNITVTKQMLLNLIYITWTREGGGGKD